MRTQDFLRRLPQSGHGLRSSSHLQHRLHLDFLLLLLLLLVTCFGLMVLYSASGQSMASARQPPPTTGCLEKATSPIMTVKAPESHAIPS
jgi:cell division protein FtsW (lipid II flippase)